MMAMTYNIGNTTSLKVSCKVGATISVWHDVYWTPKIKGIPCVYCPKYAASMEIILFQEKSKKMESLI